METIKFSEKQHCWLKAGANDLEFEATYDIHSGSWVLSEVNGRVQLMTQSDGLLVPFVVDSRYAPLVRNFEKNQYTTRDLDFSARPAVSTPMPRPEEKQEEAPNFVIVNSRPAAPPREEPDSQQSKLKTLYGAIKEGDIKRVRRLLSGGVEINSRAADGLTPLHVAVGSNNVTIAEFLLESGAEVNAPLKDGRTLLHLAARGAGREMVSLLLANGAEVNARANEGVTPLHESVTGINAGILTLLLDNGADINARNKTGRTPLHFAAIEGNREGADILISRGADINAGEQNGRTPLRLAIQIGYTELAALLRQHGAKE